MTKQLNFAEMEPAETTPPVPHSGGKDEMNLAEFPIALLTDKAPKGMKSIKFEDHFYDTKRKRHVTRRRIIEGSDEYGLPTATDDLVVLGLIQLTKQQTKGKFDSRELRFTRFELIRLLGWSTEGKNYKRIKTSLLRLQSVNYIFDNAWYEKTTKTWTTKAFHLIDNVEINDSREGGEHDSLFKCRILWNKTIFESFQVGFLRDIDFALCVKLDHPTALRMYRFLGKHFYRQTDLIFDLKEFAYEHIGLTKNYEGGAAIVRKLKPAIAELEKCGFLEALPEPQRFIKKGRVWSIRFVQKTAPASPATDSPEPEPALNEVLKELSAELEARGVTPDTALNLVTEFSAELIARQIEQFDYLVIHEPHKVSKNPGGFLKASIRGGYAAPHGFISKAEQARKQVERELAEKKAQNKRTAKARAEAQARAADQATRARLAAMTPEERQATQEAALNAAGDETRKAVENLRRQGNGAGEGYLMSITLAFLQTQACDGLPADQA